MGILTSVHWMFAIRYLAACLILLLCASSYAQENYIVSYVYDGDTVQLTNATGKFKLRLTDIDAPERNQPYGLKARRALMKLCQGDAVKVNVDIVGKDKYQRLLGKLQCNNTDASLYLLEQGYAWYPHKFSRNSKLKKVAEDAQKNNKGLWQDSNPTPPWVWRKLNAPPANTTN
ncbi:MAG TPA: thermonuclease family protein [Methylotenera sp.]|nr:thermonuclease family protein [Methylotenera sp.]